MGLGGRFFGVIYIPVDIFLLIRFLFKRTFL